MSTSNDDTTEGKVAQADSSLANKDEHDDNDIEETALNKKDDEDNEEENNNTQNAQLDFQNQPPTQAQKVLAWFLVDILIYIVILNLGAELVKNIVINSFGISICMALFLKVFLTLMTWFEHKLHDIFCESPRFGVTQKVVGALVIYFVLIAAKFVILWIDEVVFQDWVHLGHLWEVMVLALVMLVSQRLLRIIYHAFSKPGMEKFLRHIISTENWLESRLYEVDKAATPCFPHPIVRLHSNETQQTSE